jgi:hypothetical protein
MYVEKKVTTIQPKFLFKFQITYKKCTSEQYAPSGSIRMQTLKFEKFNNLIRHFNWEDSLFTLVDDVNEMADFFTNKYLEMAKECIPTKVVNIQRTDKPWFHSEIRHHIRIRDRLHKKLKSSPTVHNRNIYKIQRNKVNNMIIHAKEQFYLNANGLLDEKSNNSKGFGHL